MYFNHAFRKTLVAKNSGGTIDMATTGSTTALTAGQIGMFDGKTYSIITAAPVSGNQTFIIAQGSLHTNDKIGPFHGGYKESIKSKVINPKYVNRFFTVAAKAPKNQILQLGWAGAAGTGPEFFCNETYRLRLDLKGSPAQRYLTRNMYHEFDYFTGCCATEECEVVDPALVFKGWADQINEDPQFSNFVQAVPVISTTSQASTALSGATTITLDSTNANVVVGQYVYGTGIAAGTKVLTKPTSTSITVSIATTAAISGGTLYFATEVTDSYVSAGTLADINAGLLLIVAYEDTKFGNCTFTQTDFNELEPLVIYASLLEDKAEQCPVCGPYPVINSSTEEGVTELQAPVQATGTGETVLRELILSNSYSQEHFQDGNSIDSLRLREVLDDTNLGQVTRANRYDSINILHSVPRFNNPTGVFDNDQYLITIYVPTGTDVTELTDVIEDMLDLAGNGVELEQF